MASFYAPTTANVTDFGHASGLLCDVNCNTCILIYVKQTGKQSNMTYVVHTTATYAHQ